MSFLLIKCKVSISNDFILSKISNLEHKISLYDFKIDNLWMGITRHARQGSEKKGGGVKRRRRDAEIVTVVESCVKMFLFTVC